VPSEDHEGDDYTDHLARVAVALADVNQATARAVTRTPTLLDTPLPANDLSNAHDDLLAAYADLVRAIDVVEQMLDRLDPEYVSPTPVTLKDDHATRLKEQYDGPVFSIAMHLLERNRREWLHRKPETNGAEAVRRHGLTENQRRWLNELQEAWDDAE